MTDFKRGGQADARTGLNSKLPVPQRGGTDVTQFKPEDALKREAQGDAVIAFAKKVKDWPMLEKAIDQKIADQQVRGVVAGEGDAWKRRGSKIEKSKARTCAFDFKVGSRRPIRHQAPDHLQMGPPA
jgi:hypothetical protein